MTRLPHARPGVATVAAAILAAFAVAATAAGCTGGGGPTPGAVDGGSPVQAPSGTPGSSGAGDTAGTPGSPNERPTTVAGEATTAGCPTPPVADSPALSGVPMPRVPLTRIAAGPEGWGITATHGSVWVGGLGAALRIDADSGRQTHRVRLGEDPARPVAVAGWDGEVWAATIDPSDSLTVLFRLDPRTGRVLQRMDLRDAQPRPTIVVGSAAGMWYLSRDAADLVRIDPRSGAPLATTPLTPPGTPATLSWGFGEAVADGTSVWVSLPYDGTVVRVDADTNAVMARLCVAPVPTTVREQVQAYLPLGTGFGAVWVSVTATNEVVRIDPATNTVVARIPLPANANPRPRFPGTAGGQLWVPSGFEGFRIDPATNTVVEGVRLLSTPSNSTDGTYRIVGTPGALWTRADDVPYVVRARWP